MPETMKNVLETMPDSNLTAMIHWAERILEKRRLQRVGEYDGQVRVWFGEPFRAYDLKNGETIVAFRRFGKLEMKREIALADWLQMEIYQ